jgi:hypothetical protein
LHVSRVAIKSGGYAARRTGPCLQSKFGSNWETKGALRYQEVDEKGEVIEQAWAKIGTLYVRKSAFERGRCIPAAPARDGRNRWPMITA